MRYCIVFIIIFLTALDKLAISQDSTGFANYQIILEFHPEKHYVDSLIKIKTIQIDSLQFKLSKSYDTCIKNSYKKKSGYSQEICYKILDSIVKLPILSKKILAAYKDSLYKDLELKILKEINLFAKANNLKYIINNADNIDNSDNQIVNFIADIDLTNKIIDWIYNKYFKK